VSHAVAYEHVEFAVIIFNGEDHGHRLTDLDQARDFGSPGTFTDLDLHPATDVIAGKVGTDDVQHVNGERTESDGLLVLVVPSAAQFAGLIPHFLHLRIELNDDGVLKESSRSSLK